MSDFSAVWRSIQACTGQEFRTKSGRPFTYTAHDGYVHLDNTDRSISRTDFSRAYALMPLRGPGRLTRLVQGPSYVFGILTDDRIRG
ncbi:hypothetical protein [Streptomonospora litoralis]|uniref:Uncharacterized protein n=1 Tax=Streptomonospora litoralis TaxID=2498135 RepID=A0A4P6Q0X5_9ACTN|nr:hypothetical protein [Streptomonospora litoralis]QBI54155.1 hypothetical protein EKD16_11860 [Streptomonospora litoralis]